MTLRLPLLCRLIGSLSALIALAPFGVAQGDWFGIVSGYSSSASQNLWRSAGIELFYDRAASSLAERESVLLRDLELRTGLETFRGFGVSARVVIGTRTFPLAKELVESIGIGVDDLGFEFAGRRFTDPTARLVACFADPARSGMPVTVIFGNDPERMAEGLLELPVGETPFVEVWADGQLELFARIDSDGNLQGKPAQHAPVLRKSLAELRRFPSQGLKVWSVPPLNPRRLRRYVEAALEIEAKVIRWFGPDTGPETMLMVFDDPLTVGKFANASGGATFAVNYEAQRVAVLMAPGLSHDAGRGVAMARAVSIAGPPAQAWMLDALGLAASGFADGVPLNDVIANWSRADVGVDLREVMTQPEALRRPPTSRDGVLRALAFEHLAQTSDRPQFRRYWREGIPPSKWDELEESFRERLGALVDPGQRRENRSFADEPFAGAVLATRHDSARFGHATHGLWVDALRERLIQLKKLGANGVVYELRPTLIQREPLAGSWGANRDESLDDELELAYAVVLARLTGLRVGLSLAPILGASNTWPDQAAISAEHVDRFVERYWSRLESLVRAAETARVEFLVLGTGMRELMATRAYPNTSEREIELFQARRDGVRTLIKRTRRIFGGPIGYEARSGSELERGWPDFTEARVMASFDDWDFLALHCVPRFKERPTAARRIESVLEKLIDEAIEDDPEVPLFLLSGAASASQAWRYGAPVGVADLAWQRMHGQALMSEFVESVTKRNLVGVAWTYLHANPKSDEPVDFDPLGTPAEGELEMILRGVSGR